MFGSEKIASKSLLCIFVVNSRFSNTFYLRTRKIFTKCTTGLLRVMSSLELVARRGRAAGCTVVSDIPLQDIDYSCSVWCQLDDYLGLGGRLMLLVHSTVNIGYNYQGATQNVRAMVALFI